MIEVTHRFIEANGITIHLAEQGRGPAILLCHGFPESWYSWHHQMAALAAAGYRAIAPDMRGYGQTSQPAAIDQYSIFHLAGDMVAILDALELETAVIAGHDWGAPVAWHAALLRPDRFRGIIALSVPYRQRGLRPPTTAMPRTEDSEFYQLYFQRPDRPDADLAADVRASLLKIFYASSGEGFRGGAGIAMVSLSKGYLKGATIPPAPSWLTPGDLAFYAAEFTRTGFTGALNWYRNIDRNWDLTAAYAGAKITVPALYIAGDKDLVIAFPGMEKTIARLPELVPKLRETIMLPGCGHWTQQERPAEVNAAMLKFLETV
jgi:pimeloyl-ACP methyl ester carboxylesterase